MLVSALVCTRNRAASLVRTVTSLLTQDGLLHEVVVIDQSDNDETEQALKAIAHDRLRYFKSRAVGKGAALNEGLGYARGEIVVCTDDDCEAPPDWVSSMTRALERYPRVAIAFCNVVAPSHDRNAGYVPTYERSESRLLHSVLDLSTGYGLGAGMALRKEAILSVGGCDETMGPGARFKSGDDIDLAIRVLQLGWHVLDTVETSIIHHGFRPHTTSRAHVGGDWFALGATCSKSVRGRRLLGAVPTLWLFTTQALWPPVKHVATLRKPFGLTRITAFVQGFAKGVTTPVDRERMLFLA